MEEQDIKKQILIEYLSEISDEIMHQYQKLEDRNVQDHGVVDDFTLSVCDDSHWIRSLIDALNYGELELDEIVDTYLDPQEREEYFSRLNKTLQQTNNLQNI